MPGFLKGSFKNSHQKTFIRTLKIQLNFFWSSPLALAQTIVVWKWTFWIRSWGVFQSAFRGGRCRDLYIKKGRKILSRGIWWRPPGCASSFRLLYECIWIPTKQFCMYVYHTNVDKTYYCIVFTLVFLQVEWKEEKLHFALQSKSIWTFRILSISN